MPLPQKVIEQLGREPSSTQGWAFGMILFSGGLLALVIVIYLGLTYGYDPYINGQITSAQNQIDQLNNSISPTDQANLINFYSQTSNLNTLIHNHVLTSQLLTWLEKNTEANVYYTNFALANNDQITLSAVGLSIPDVNEQIAIFENSPEVLTMSVSGVSNAQITSGYAFKVTLDMTPSLFAVASPTIGTGAQASSSAPSVTQSTATSTTGVSTSSTTQ